jgi:hypothetical protein
MNEWTSHTLLLLFLLFPVNFSLFPRYPFCAINLIIMTSPVKYRIGL